MYKICTSLEQSKKLVELGINVNTADMGWNVFVDDTTRILPIDDWNLVKDGSGNVKFYPAWSLTALLGLMPKLYEFESVSYDGGCQPNLCKGWSNNLWHVFYRSSIYITEWHEDPIDAAFEMVVWLKENGKL